MEGESMSEWKEVKLGDVILHSCSGGTPKSNVSEYYDGEIPWLNTKEIDFNRIYQTERNITQKGLDNSSAKWIDEKCVIIAMYGATAGKIAINMIPLTTNQACCNLKVDDRLADFRYIYYFLKKDFKFLASLANGGAQQNLNSQIIKDYVIKLPSLSIQKEISDLLWTIDAKIETNNKLNEKLEEMAQAIFKSWFVDFEPFKDKPFHETELGMIPEGWDIYTIDEFCRVFTGKKNTNQAEKNGKYPFFSCAPNPLNSNDYLYDGYAIIIAGNGSYTGRTQLYNGKFDLYQRTYACVAKERSFDKKIVFFYLLMKQTFEKEKMGGTRGSSIPYIVMNDIAKQYFCYNESVVSKFCNIVRPILDMKHELQVESKRLASLRDTLLPRLMSGELTV